MQLVTETVKLCNAVILFAELHRAGDSADRVLMYPKAWDGAAEGDDEASTSTSRRLLEVAAKEYNVLLEPVEPVLEDAKRELTRSNRFYILTLAGSVSDLDFIPSFPPPIHDKIRSPHLPPSLWHPPQFRPAY